MPLLDIQIYVYVAIAIYMLPDESTKLASVSYNLLDPVALIAVSCQIPFVVVPDSMMTGNTKSPQILAVNIMLLAHCPC